MVMQLWALWKIARRQSIRQSTKIESCCASATPT